MRMSSLFLYSIVWLMLLPAALFGGYSQVNGTWSADRYVPTLTMQEHYDQGYQYLHDQHWEEALTQFMVVVYHFPESPFYSDALFYTGVCYYYQNELDLANKQFDKYLNLGGKLKHFEKVFDFKLEIASFYAEGKKKHIFGLKKLPKWAPAKADAIKLYDEIIAALPAQDVGAEALYRKAALLRVRREYVESIEALHTLVRRFPKHSLTPESYLRISEIYLEQSHRESQNPDLIALAQVNLHKFGKNFPADERVFQAHESLVAMQEVYAQSLYETGRFYERKKKPHASMIYYQDTVLRYPETKAAAKSNDRLAKLAVVSTPVR
jgi:outer membrane protein assembly factor BamD (BamD/ComL family)